MVINIESKTVKLLEENLQENLSGLGLKAYTIKEKIDIGFHYN